MNRLEEYLKKYEKIHSGESSIIVAKNGIPTGEGMLPFGDGVEFVKKVFPFIDDMIKQKDRAITILDYGCGQAFHTFKQDYYGHSLQAPKLVGKTIFSFFPGMIQSYYCYDPAVKRYSTKPSPGTLFDMVVLADVLEHIPEENVVDLIREARRFCKHDGLIMFTISGDPAFTHFVNEDGSMGENAHITIKTLKEWGDIINSNVGNLTFVIMYTTAETLKQTNNNGDTITMVRNSVNYKISPDVPQRIIVR